MDNRFNLQELIDLLVAETGMAHESGLASSESKLADFGLDSLAFLQLQAVVDDRFGTELPDDLVDASLGQILASINEGTIEKVRQS